MHTNPSSSIPRPFRSVALLVAAGLCAVLPLQNTHAQGKAPEKLTVNEGDRIALVGAGMGSRMIHFGHFETELFLRFPNSDISIRNLCDEGNTPGFRPHPGRNHDGQYAFPGAKELVPKKFQIDTKPGGHFETPDQWLSRLEADTVIAFFGFNSSFEGPADAERFKKELDAFIKHTLAQKYNGKCNLRFDETNPSKEETEYVDSIMEDVRWLGFDW